MLEVDVSTSIDAALEAGLAGVEGNPVVEAREAGFDLLKEGAVGEGRRKVSDDDLGAMGGFSHNSGEGCWGRRVGKGGGS